MLSSLITSLPSKHTIHTGEAGARGGGLPAPGGRGGRAADQGSGGGAGGGAAGQVLGQGSSADGNDVCCRVFVVSATSHRLSFAPSDQVDRRLLDMDGYNRYRAKLEQAITAVASHLLAFS